VRIPTADKLSCLSRGIWDRWLASPAGSRFDAQLSETRWSGDQGFPAHHPMYGIDLHGTFVAAIS
jgi:hypothetical protein